MYLSIVVSSETGLLHLTAALVAVCSGTLVLLLPKGTRLHKRVGYVYTGSMMLLLATAFMIYRLFGRWGVFHWAAVVSAITLFLGMVPLLLRKRRYQATNSRNLVWHLSFMYWSVVGLYGALVAESFVRLPGIVLEDGLPNRTFYNITGMATGAVMALGVFFFLRLQPKWAKLHTQTQQCRANQKVL